MREHSPPDLRLVQSDDPLDLRHLLARAQPTLGEVEQRLAERHRSKGARRTRQRVNTAGSGAERLRREVERDVEHERVVATWQLIEIYRELGRQGAGVPVELSGFLTGVGTSVITAKDPLQALQHALGLQLAARPGPKRTKDQDARELKIAVAVARRWAGGPRHGGVTLEQACADVSGRFRLGESYVKKIYGSRGREARLSLAEL